nr:M1 family peptidase [Bacteroidota bacterium]
VHETAHEWWANNITYKDIGDMWIHESFANYAESLFLDYHFGTQAGNEYVIGTRHNIDNQAPIINAYYDAPDSRDMYYKGGNMLHTLRTWIKDDALFRNMLRGLQKEFYHKTVTSAQIESYMASFSGKNLVPFFNQYLRDTRIPVLEYTIKGKSIKYRYSNVVDGFAMPVDVSIDKGEQQRIVPCENWQEIKTKTTVRNFQADQNFYIQTKEVMK